MNIYKQYGELDLSLRINNYINKKGSLGGNMKRVSITILTMIIIGGVVFSGYKLYEYKEKAISEVEVMLFTPSVVESEINTKRIVNEEILANENTLKEKNSDYRMWIKMDETNINYPVLQGEDNDFYLYSDFDGNYYYPGSIFIDYRNDIENDNNLWIFGHNMADGSMFADLVKLKDETYFNENPEIILVKDGIQYIYEIFAVNVVPADGAEIVLDFDNEDEMNRYMERVKEESIFYRDIKVEDIVEEEGISSLITMVTCSYEFDDARTLVSAALKPVQ
mgnify:FL=1|jgi:sortase B